MVAPCFVACRAQWHLAYLECSSKANVLSCGSRLIHGRPVALPAQPKQTILVCVVCMQPPHIFACCLLLLHRLLYNSVHLLHAATRLKQKGVLPPDLQLWAVANPVTEPSAALAAAKVGGCQVQHC